MDAPAPSAVAPITACVSSLVGRAVAACSAAPGAPYPEVRLTLDQSLESPGLLSIRVQDNGLAAPKELPALHKVFGFLQRYLSSPLFESNRLDVATSDGEDVLLRLYSVAAAESGLVHIAEAGTEAKPRRGPGQHPIQGTRCSFTVRLPAGVWPEAIAASTEALLLGLKVLAPPAFISLALQNVLAQGEAGEVEALSGISCMAEPPDASLGLGLQLLEGMKGAYETVEPVMYVAPALEGGGSQDPVAAVLARMLGGDPAGEGAGPGQQPGPELLAMLTHASAGEAGWGCEGAAEQFRGCRWSARVGVALLLPEQAGAVPAVQDPAATMAGGPGTEQQQQQQQQQPSSQQQHTEIPPPPRLPLDGAPLRVQVFRNYAAQQGELEGIVKGLKKVDWDAFGFKLVGAGGGAAASSRTGAVNLQLQCAQPKTLARLAAVVVHFQSREVLTELTTGVPLPLAATYEARLVKAAVEDALLGLKNKFPTVLADRRHRSLMRSVPCVARSVAGVLARAPESSLVQEALGLLGCEAGAAEAELDQLITSMVNATIQERAAEKAEAKKRQRRQGSP